MLLSSTPHPSLSVRPLLSEFDAFISDAQLEALYIAFESVSQYPAHVAFRIIFPAIRGPYKDHCIEIKTQFDVQTVLLQRAEQDKRDLVRQIEAHDLQLERVQQDKRDLVRQIEAHDLQLDRGKQDKRDLVRQIDAHALQLERVEQDKRDLVRQIAAHAMHMERVEQDKRDLVRQIESHDLQLDRVEQDKRELVHHIQQQAEARKFTDEAHARQVAQMEQQLVEYRADRADAIANERQSSLIVQNHLLQSPRLQTPQLRGSVTRATRWQQAKNSPKYSKRALPVNTAVATVIRQQCEPLVQVLVTKNYPTETFMYPDFLALLEKALTNMASYHDTSRNPYLTGLEPDLTLALYGVRTPDPVSVLVLVEVKKRSAALGTDAILGQLLDYLVALMGEQQGRRFFTGVISNVSENLVVTLEVTDTGCAIVEHHISTIYETLAYLHETSLVQLSHRPPTLGFAPELGPMEKRLGHTRQSVVGQFSPPFLAGQVIAVKRAVSAGPEIALLRSFANQQPLSIPCLVYVADDLSEFGITPVGIPLVPGAFANNEQARCVISDIHAALTWLHGRGVVHRDVRCDNVVIDDRGHGILIDFDAACGYRRGSLRIWRGGYICCPPRLIREVHRHGWLKTYAPSASDDWHAFVLMVNCLVFPTTFIGFQSHLVGTPNTEEARRLLALWDAMEKSVVWGPFVDAAAEGKPEVLVKLSHAFVWL